MSSAVFHKVGPKPKNPLLLNISNSTKSVSINRKEFKDKFNKYMSKGKSIYLDFGI